MDSGCLCSRIGEWFSFNFAIRDIRQLERSEREVKNGSLYNSSHDQYYTADINTIIRTQATKVTQS